MAKWVTKVTRTKDGYITEHRRRHPILVGIGLFLGLAVLAVHVPWALVALAVWLPICIWADRQLKRKGK